MSKTHEEIKREIALQVFLTKMPSGYFSDLVVSGYTSAAAQAFEVAELFLKVEKEHEARLQAEALKKMKEAGINPGAPVPESEL